MKQFSTVPGCLPREQHPDKAAEAVLLIHGYTGTPRDMNYLADRLAATGRAVSIPRLPGAATDMEDLSRTTRHMWRRHVLGAWQDLKSRYDHVSVVGFSMGGVLALDLASRVTLDRVAVLAPALLVSNPVVRFTPFLAPFHRILPEVTTGWTPEEDDDETTRELGRRYWSRRDVRSLAQLRFLQIATRRRLKHVTAPVMTIISSNDPTVPTRVIGVLERGLSRGLERSLVVDRCGHNVPDGADRETVADAVVSWFEGK